MNSIQRSDMAVIGTWRDDIQIEQDEVKAFVAKKGRKYVIDNVIPRCPTQAMSLNDDDAPGYRQQELRALHALHQCHDQGAVAR